MRTFKIFAERELSDYLDKRKSKMYELVNNKITEQSLSTGEYLQELLHKSYELYIEPLKIDTENKFIDDREENILAELFPGGFDVSQGKSYPKQVITYHIPYTGAEELLYCVPNPKILWTEKVYLQDNCICFDIIDFYGDPERIKNKANDIINKISIQAKNVENQVERFNQGLSEELQKLVEVRRDKIISQKKLVASLGVPVKKTTPQLIGITDKTNKALNAVQHQPLMDKKHNDNIKYDVFICHASEDKETFVRLLAEKLKSVNLNVWYDEFSLKLGDSLRKSIDQGIAMSKYGIVILSANFFMKNWPQQELNGLFAKEVQGVKVILPIWHNINQDEIMKYSPMIADKKAVKTSDGLDKVVKEILNVINSNAL